MSNTKKLRNFVFTSFDFNIIPHDAPEVQYLCFGVEICPETNKQHMQGYCELKNPYSFKWIKEQMGTAHIEARKGNQKQAIDYCKKDGDFHEFGTPKKQGKRNDLPSMQDLAEITSVRELYEEHTENCIRLSSGMEKAYNIARQGKLEDDLREEINKIELYPWQQQCILDIESVPRRKISWYWEPIGNVGKSHLVTWFAVNYNTLVLTDTSYKDCTYLYNDHEYVIFDLARSEFDPNWKTIEAFTNHYVTSRKYVPVNKICRAKVIVFSNSPPDEAALSADRWNIRKISGTKVNGPEVGVILYPTSEPTGQQEDTNENIAQN